MIQLRRGGNCCTCSQKGELKWPESEKMVRLLALNGLRNNHLEAEVILLSPDIPA